MPATPTCASSCCTAADVYRELGEDEAYEALQQRQLALVIDRYGPLHDNVLNGQLEAAIRAYHRGKLPECRRLLAEADDSIRRAGRDRDPLRAHWWSTRGMCLRDQADQADARLQAQQKAVALLPNLSPANAATSPRWRSWRPNTATKAGRPSPWLSIDRPLPWQRPSPSATGRTADLAQQPRDRAATGR